MVSTALYLLTIAVVAGAGLALWHLRATEGTSRPPLAAGVAHGVVGAVGVAALLLALTGPPRAVASGAGDFGVMAAWLFGAAVLTGSALLLLRRKAPAAVMAIHSGLAITGYVLLLAWNALG